MTVVWNPGLNTDGEVTAKRLDIIIKKREKMHIDKCDQYLLTERSRKRKRKMKINRSSCVELERMWYMKCKITPVVIGAIGKATKGLKKNWKPYKENIQHIHYKRHHTLHIRWKVLQSET
jgi:hypothetical protein